MNILEIKNVNIYYGGKEVLREINIDVKKNEILCIMGPSGCGKSTDFLLKTAENIQEMSS